EINDASQIRAALPSLKPFAQRAALIALDQMPGGNLQANEVAPLLQSAHSALKLTANWIVSHRQNWGNELVKIFADQLRGAPPTEAEAAELEQQFAVLAGAPAIQEFLASTALDRSIPIKIRRTALQGMARARLKIIPSSWNESLIQLLRSDEYELVRSAVSAAASFPEKEQTPALRVELLRAGNNQRLPSLTRVEALKVLPPGGDLTSELFAFLRSELAEIVPISERATAASVLAKAKFTEQQLVVLASDLRKAGPLEIARLSEIFEKSSSKIVGEALLANLGEAKSLAALHADRLRIVLAKYPATLQETAGKLLSLLDQDSSKQGAVIDELLPKLKDGDVRHGQALFNSTRAACSSCHAIGYLGGNVGPDLTRIGQVRTERDLLEAIVYPSASFVRSYEPFIVSTKSGEDFSGVLRKDAADEIIIASGPGAEIHIPREDVAAMRPGKVSVMPQGLNEQLTHQELGDLLAFLKSTRW
ncbi:MAG TPA: dehydrogenase, partial [Verrucomicrobiae bacterium]|nr:dehydrogenase [Verrucomicrobiae bacterium]